MLDDSLEGKVRVEGFRGKDNGGGVSGAGEEAEDGAEAVEERWWAANGVVFCESHAVTNGFAIVEDALVRELGCFW